MEKVFDIVPTEGLRRKKCAFLTPLEVMAETRQEQLFLALEFGIKPGLVDAGCFFKRLKVGIGKTTFPENRYGFLKHHAPCKVSRSAHSSICNIDRIVQYSG